MRYSSTEPGGAPNSRSRRRANSIPRPTVEKRLMLAPHAPAQRLPPACGRSVSRKIRAVRASIPGRILARASRPSYPGSADDTSYGTARARHPCHCENHCRPQRVRRILVNQNRRRRGRARRPTKPGSGRPTSFLYLGRASLEKWAMPMHRWWLAVWWLSVCLNSSESLRAAGNVARGRLPFIIDVWETDDGLPQNSVISMIQTRDGYLWLGTLNGLVRFDGVRFTVFDESNTRGLTSSQIVSLFEDSRSNLWVGTESGGAFLIKDGRVTSLDIGRGTREGRLRASCEDSSGGVWLYPADGQLCRHRDGRVDVWTFGGVSLYRGLIQAESGAIRVGVDWGLFTIGPTGGLGATELPQQGFVPLGKLDFLLASRRGGHWRLSEGRVYKWGPDRMERDFGPYPWGAVAVAAACEDREGNLVVGTLGGGVFWFDADGKVTRLSTEQGLSYNYILSLTVDREGSLWVGTDGGGRDRVKRKVFDTLEDSRGLVVQSVCADAQGDLWIGYNGGGVDHCTNGVCQRLRPRVGSIG